MMHVQSGIDCALQLLKARGCDVPRGVGVLVVPALESEVDAGRAGASALDNLSHFLLLCVAGQTIMIVLEAV